MYPPSPPSTPRVVDPPLEELDSLRQPLTEGERRVLDWFLAVLPARWEIYIQPHLNGLRPDFVLLHSRNGIAVYEVKDWDLRAVNYHVQDDRGRARLMGRKGGRTFALDERDPVAAIDQYKREIYALYVPSLPVGQGLGVIAAGIIFTNATTSEARELLAPLREERGHSQREKLYPVIGSERVGDAGPDTLRLLLNSAHRADDRMTDGVVRDLRYWLVEPSFAREQRVPLARMMTPQQRALCLNREQVKFRRIKGPAGSGKSLVLAGRAAELARQGRRVLLVTFNITLINYLLDLAVQYAQSGKVRNQITALNFHHWCKRVAFLNGHEREYAAIWGERGDAEAGADDILGKALAVGAASWCATLRDEDRWDALLVDEGQDFLPAWWAALRAALTLDGSGEALLVADAQQNVYGVAPWTETEMAGAGFRGRWSTLEQSFRMSPSLCQLATAFVDRFQPEADSHRPLPAQAALEFRTVLRWQQVERSEAPAACVEALLAILAASADDPVATADLVCMVDQDEIGGEIVHLLRERRIRTIHTFGRGDSEMERQEDSRRKKLAFFKGDARVKVTTVQSFKGWEGRSLVVQISDASDAKALARAYAGITRLKSDDRGCFLTVVCSAVELRAYGQTWPRA